MLQLTKQLFLSELPISTFYGKQFYQKQVRKISTIPNLRIAEHICGRNWWLPVRQYRDQRNKKRITYCDFTNFSRFVRLPFPFWILKICQSVADISITSQFHEFQNISVEESDGCQYDSIVISDTKNVSLDRSARLCGLYHQQDPTSLQKR